MCLLAALAAFAPVRAVSAERTAEAPAESVKPCRARDPASDRPRVGVVLGGGGARGVAHISVLRALEQNGVPVDCIAGTSMGALVGSLYASGMTTDEIEALVKSMDWQALFNDRLTRPERSYRRKRDDDLVLSQPGVGFGKDGSFKVASGLLAGERMTLLFGKLVEPVSTIEDFDQLPIPFRAIAADANTGQAVSIGDGDLAAAMRASMSIPGVFPPVNWRGRVLVDGGVASNLPVQVIRDMGADIVIAVDVGTPLGVISPDSNVLEIAGQLTGLLTVNNSKASIAQLGERDILIQPALEGHVATADFDKFVEALEIGRVAVEPLQGRFQAIALPPADYQAHLATRVGRQSAPPVINEVRIVNESHYSDAYIAARIDVPIGQPLDAAELDRQLYRLYGQETFSGANYEVIGEEGRNVLQVKVKGKTQGPTYLETGLSMSTDFEGRLDFSFRLGLLRSPANSLGGEWRLLAQVGDDRKLLGEYYQPFGTNGFYAGLRGQYSGDSLLAYGNDGRPLAEFEVNQSMVELVLGKELSNYGALTLGYRRAWGESESATAADLFPSTDFERGEAWLDLTLDRLDSIYLPRQGQYLTARYLVSRESLGADVDFDQLDVDTLVARKFGPHSMQLGLRYHTTLDGTPPIQSLYRLGGFTRFAGIRPNSLTGSDYGLILVGYNYELGNLFNQPAVVGGTLEHGNAWQSRDDISLSDAITNGSVYLGVDSWLGPIVLGMGFGEGGHHLLFLNLGQKF